MLCIVVAYFFLVTQHTTDVNEGPKWVKMQSITQENDLDAFLSTAALAGTDFTAGK
jgi:large subunit GTPase 1